MNEKLTLEAALEAANAWRIALAAYEDDHYVRILDALLVAIGEATLLEREHDCLQSEHSFLQAEFKTLEQELRAAQDKAYETEKECNTLRAERAEVDTEIERLRRLCGRFSRDAGRVLLERDTLQAKLARLAPRDTSAPQMEETDDG